jgi:hypothetical protein
MPPTHNRGERKVANLRGEEPEKCKLAMPGFARTALSLPQQNLDGKYKAISMPTILWYLSCFAVCARGFVFLLYSINPLINNK